MSGQGDVFLPQRPISSRRGASPGVAPLLSRPSGSGAIVQAAVRSQHGEDRRSAEDGADRSEGIRASHSVSGGMHERIERRQEFVATLAGLG